jgi:hypothetical protein
MMEVPMASQATAGSEFRVNTTTGGDQDRSVMTALADGGWVVVWQGRGPIDADGIFMQRFDAMGVAQGAQTRVNTTTLGPQELPSVTTLSDGGWVVTWSGEGQDDRSGVFQQRFDDEGARMGAELRVNSTISGDQTRPSVVALSNGGWVVAWQGEGPGDDYGIFARRFTGDGTPREPDQPLNWTTASWQMAPAIAALPNSEWLVAWQSFGQDARVTDGVFMQRFSADLGAYSFRSDQGVNSTTAGEQFAPSVAVLADNGWVVTWNGGGPGRLYGIHQQRYDNDGNKVGREARVSNATSDYVFDPKIAALADGGWVVVWFGQGDGDHCGIFQQRYGASGNRVGEETLVNIASDGGQTNPSVTALADGSWIVSWSSSEGNNDTYGSPPDVFQRHFAPDRIGGAGDDTIEGTGWAERLDGRGGADEAHGRGGNDTVLGGGGRDEIFGDDGHDSLDGGSGHDTLNGGAGKDRLEGNDGNDRLTGGTENDVLDGGSGNDTVVGGGGADTLTGGTGADEFQFNDVSDSTPGAFDTIRDFKASYGGDRIDLSRLDAGPYPEFVFDGAAGTAPGQGHVSVGHDPAGRHTYVYVNIDKDPEVDMVIRLKGWVDLTKSDFIL